MVEIISKIKFLNNGPAVYVLAALMAIILYGIFPAVALSPATLPVQLLSVASACMGYVLFLTFFRKTPSIAPAEFDIRLVFSLVFILLCIKGLNGELSFLQFSGKDVDVYLNTTDQYAARNVGQIISNIIETATVIGILGSCARHPKTSAILLIIIAIFTLNIHRSVFAIYFFMALYCLSKGNISIGRITLFTCLSLAIFYLLSVVRGDTETSALGNVYLTAVGYPALNLQRLIDTGISGEWRSYVQQLLIKPFPATLLEPFGGKPIFNFNAEMTRIISGRDVDANQPISVFTAAGALAYYQPSYAAWIVQSFIYILVYIYGRAIERNQPILIFTAADLFMSHRSNLLDFVSDIIKITVAFYFVLGLKQLFFNEKSSHNSKPAGSSRGP
jgi:hypothetical protein